MIEWAPIIAAGIGATASAGNSFLSNWLGGSSTKKAQSRAYRYYLRSLDESPLRTRQGLEAAGYNPLLALGSVGGQSFSAGSSPSFAPVGDMVSGSESGARLANQLFRGIKLDNKKKELENKNLESDLDTKEVQRLQMEANQSLLQSQAERSDLAYGRDIVNTVTDIAGTGASLYSAKAMADVAKQNANTNARNAAVREKKANIKNKGVPAVDTSAKGSKPNIGGVLGSSARTAGRIARDLAFQIVLPAFIGTAGGEYMQTKSEELNRKSNRDNGKERVKFRGYGGRLHSLR